MLRAANLEEGPWSPLLAGKDPHLKYGVSILCLFGLFKLCVSILYTLGGFCIEAKRWKNPWSKVLPKQQKCRDSWRDQGKNRPTFTDSLQWGNSLSLSLSLSQVDLCIQFDDHGMRLNKLLNLGTAVEATRWWGEDKEADKWAGWEADFCGEGEEREGEGEGGSDLRGWSERRYGEHSVVGLGCQSFWCWSSV